MKDKQKQVEEMAKKSGGCLYPNNHCGANGKGRYCWCDARKLCENLADHYQPKILEGEVVLPRVQYEEMKWYNSISETTRLIKQERKETVKKVMEDCLRDTLTISTRDYGSIEVVPLDRINEICENIIRGDKQ